MPPWLDTGAIMFTGRRDVHLSVRLAVTQVSDRLTDLSIDYPSARFPSIIFRIHHIWHDDVSSLLKGVGICPRKGQTFLNNFKVAPWNNFGLRSSTVLRPQYSLMFQFVLFEWNNSSWITVGLERKLREEPRWYETQICGTQPSGRNSSRPRRTVRRTFKHVHVKCSDFAKGSTSNLFWPSVTSVHLESFRVPSLKVSGQLFPNARNKARNLFHGFCSFLNIGDPSGIPWLERTSLKTTPLTF